MGASVTALRPRERRMLVVAAIVALAVVGYVYGIEPAIQRQAEIRELTVARRALLERQKRLVGRADRYARDIESLRTEIAQRRARLLPGDRAPVAASELQKLVKATAQDTGIEVRSERILAPVERGGYTEVSVEVTLAGPVRALAAFLYRLDGAPALLTLTDFRVRVASVTAPRELTATVSVAGYFPTPAAPPGTPARPTVPAARPGG